MNIVVVCLSVGLIDPRPDRLARTLSSLGHNVTLIGFRKSGIDSNGRAYRYVQIEADNFLTKLGKIIRLAVSVIAKSMEAQMQSLIDFKIPEQFYRKIQDQKPDIWIPMDLALLPVIYNASQSQRRSKIWFEAREFYSGQRHNNLLWRATISKIIANIERSNLRKCDVVTTVSEGIANHYATMMASGKSPEVVFGFPEETLLYSHKPQSPIQIIFHGNISFSRDLHFFLAKLGNMRGLAQITIRGKGSPVYVFMLKMIVFTKGMTRDIIFEKAVPYTDLIFVTTQFDFGLIPWRNQVFQRRFSMPNKLFEYFAAGIPVICSKDSEISSLVEKKTLGITFDPRFAGNIVDLLQGIDSQKYEQMVNNVIRFREANGIEKFIKQTETILSTLTNIN